MDDIKKRERKRNKMKNVFYYADLIMNAILLIMVLIGTYIFLFTDSYWSFSFGLDVSDLMGRMFIYIGGSYALLKIGDWID